MKTCEILNEIGLKATPQRIMVYEIMCGLGHSSIDDIIAEVNKKSPEMTLSTIYRILDSFCKAGLVAKLSCPNGKCFYDITAYEHYHVFKNNEIIDYIDPELTTLIRNHLKEKLFKHSDDIKRISIQIAIK
ncbi:MAG: transcriptional repressor [Bacteroidales bacterium]|jgi:Fe2+ or Zn2+ uptake regulation protein|nr:transcriptional repressor [Bacteroidales bacterium]